MYVDIIMRDTFITEIKIKTVLKLTTITHFLSDFMKTDKFLYQNINWREYLHEKNMDWIYLKYYGIDDDYHLIK